MLNEKLVKFCNENFDDPKTILNKLFEYKKILIKENESMNLIGKSTIGDLDERHFLDCIQIVKFLPNHERSLMDIGTGAGLPGIILSIKLQLDLNYRVHNKSITEILDLNVDCITARAFASVEKIISMTKNIINKKTKFILLKGRSYLTELKAINPQKYSWETHPSITSSESKIIIMVAK